MIHSSVYFLFFTASLPELGQIFNLLGPLNLVPFPSEATQDGTFIAGSRNCSRLVNSNRVFRAVPMTKPGVRIRNKRSNFSILPVPVGLHLYFFVDFIADFGYI